MPEINQTLSALLELDRRMNEGEIKPNDRAEIFRSEISLILEGIEGVTEAQVLAVLEANGWIIPPLFNHQLFLEIKKTA